MISRLLVGFLAVGLIAAPSFSADTRPMASPAPLKLPPTPRLRVSDTEIEQIKTRVAKTPELKKIYDDLISQADAWVGKIVAPPDRGGQWHHWYSCKTDGARLKAESPTKHVCTVCKAVYTGWPYDDVYIRSIHDDYSRGALSLGLAYRFTRKQEFAAKAREILLAYAEKYPTYPQHNKDGKPGPHGGKVGCQKLDEATWSIPVIRGADLVWDTLSADDQAKIETGLFRPLVTEMRLQNLGIHNIQCWMNSAIGLIGLLINEPEFVKFAVDSPSGFKEQIAKGISADGQWYEGAWGYHFYTINGTLPLTEAGRLCGLGLYEHKRNGRSFQDMFAAPIKLKMPDGSLPAFNDSTQTTLAGNSRHYETGFARYADPAYAAVLRGSERKTFETLLNGAFPLPSASTGETKSQNYPGTGYAVMQHGEGKDASWLCLKYGPHGGSHGHPDKLSFVFYAAGQTLGIDPGTANYGVPLQSQWYKSTLAHNTLVVDGANQKQSTGQSLDWLDKGDATAILADAGPIYDGVKYRRAAALFGKDLLVVLDIAESATEHTYDFAYHNAGKWSSIPAGEAIELGDKPGYIALRGMVKTTQPLPAIQSGNLPISISTASTLPTETFTGTGVGVNATDRVPVVITRTKATNVAVAWAISLTKEPVAVKLEAAGEGKYLVTAGTRKLTVDLRGKGEVGVE